VHISKGLKQAYALQDATFEAAIALKTAMNGQPIARGDAVALAALVKAWEACQNRIRIHRGKGLPASFKPAPVKQKRRPALTDLSPDFSAHDLSPDLRQTPPSDKP